MLIPSKHCGYRKDGIRLYCGPKGGGSDAPPPDPALIAAQIKSMGIQDKAIEDILAQTKELAPLQKEQMRFGLDSAKTAYDQSQADREYALGRRSNLTGLQDAMISDARSFNEGERADQLAEQAQADVTSSFDNAAAQQQRALTRTGVNPAAGKTLALANETNIMRAASGAGAANQARTAARTEGYALTDRATNALAGYPSLASGATGAGANYGTAGLGVTNAGLAGLNAGANTAAGLAGSMGANAANMYGAQTNYKLGSERNQGDGGAGLVVGLATAAATAF